MISNINNNILDYGKRESTSVRNNHTLLSLHLSFLFIPGSKFYVVQLPPKKKKKSYCNSWFWSDQIYQS